MKANELRIGNYVTDDDGVSIYSVARVETWNNGDDFNVYVLELGRKERYLEGDFKPITLTEEWLLKFGFNKIVYDSEETGYSVEYNLEVNKDIFISYLDDFSCAIFASEERRSKDFGVLPKWEAIRYVHQLQNLYFALTGEELTFKSE
jgi:hypothetical protein